MVAFASASGLISMDDGDRHLTISDEMPSRWMRTVGWYCRMIRLRSRRRAIQQTKGTAHLRLRRPKACVVCWNVGHVFSTTRVDYVASDSLCHYDLAAPLEIDVNPPNTLDHRLRHRPNQPANHDKSTGNLADRSQWMCIDIEQPACSTLKRSKELNDNCRKENLDQPDRCQQR